jgi:hypothetical protein
MAKGNFGGKKAAPFGSRKSAGTNRKKGATKTAAGTMKARPGYKLVDPDGIPNNGDERWVKIKKKP